MYFVSSHVGIHFFPRHIRLTHLCEEREASLFIQSTSKMYSPLEIDTYKPTIYSLSYPNSYNA
jgi:hypothetical protein